MRRLHDGTAELVELDAGRHGAWKRLFFEVAAEHTRAGGMFQPAECLVLDLTDALARQRELPADLVQRASAVDADAAEGHGMVTTDAVMTHDTARVVKTSRTFRAAPHADPTGD